MHLAELDLLRSVKVPGRLQNYEERVAVALDLGPLVRLDGVFDRQLVQSELAGDSGELLLGRLVEADPGQPVRVAHSLVGLSNRVRLDRPAPIHIDGIIYYHHPYTSLHPFHRQAEGLETARQRGCQGSWTGTPGSGVVALPDARGRRSASTAWI